MNPPSDAALKLAEAICAELCQPAAVQSIARFIDTELLLPEKHAALLLAQGVTDAEDKWDGSFGPERDSMIQAMDILRTALSKLR